MIISGYESTKRLLALIDQSYTELYEIRICQYSEGQFGIDRMRGGITLYVLVGPTDKIMPEFADCLSPLTIAEFLEQGE